MSGQGRRGAQPLVGAAVLGVGSWYVLDWSGPVVVGTDIDPVSAAAALGLFVAGSTALSHSLEFGAKALDWMRVRMPTGLKGTAGWVKRLSEIKHDLVWKRWGPYWGVFKRREVIAGFEASAYVCGTSGSGKSTKLVQPQAMSLKGYDKFIIDFKSDLAPVLAPALRRRRESVRILNLGGLFPEHVGESDEYNPLNIIADDCWHAGGLQDITDDVFEMCLQLYPEPKGGGGKDDNRYFRDGSRTLIAFAIQMAVLLHGYEATLGDVVQLLNDRENLLNHALWAAGRLDLAEGDA